METSSSDELTNFLMGVKMMQEELQSSHIALQNQDEYINKLRQDVSERDRTIELRDASLKMVEKFVNTYLACMDADKDTDMESYKKGLLALYSLERVFGFHLLNAEQKQAVVDDWEIPEPPEHNHDH